MHGYNVAVVKIRGIENNSFVLNRIACSTECTYTYSVHVHVYSVGGRVTCTCICKRTCVYTCTVYMYMHMYMHKDFNAMESHDMYSTCHVINSAKPY